MNKFASAACSILLASAAITTNAAAHAQTADQGQSYSAAQLPADPPEVLTEDEAALLLRVERSALVDLALSGQVPGRMVGNGWRFSRAALLGWLAGYRQGLVASERRLASRAPLSSPLDAQAATAIVGRGLGGAAQATQQVESDRSDTPIGTAPKGRTASEVFLRDQRILLAPNELTIDFGLFYARNDDLVLGNAGNGTTLGLVETDSFGGVLVGRYSIGRDTELFANSSYLRRRIAIIANGQPFSSDTRGDFGDIGVGIRRTIVHEGPGRPDIIVTVEGSIPTGASSYGLGGGVTLVKSFDPAVLFGSLNYRHTFSREFADITRLQPRDRIEAEIGYAFALNDTLILNSALSGIFNSEASFANANFRQNEIFNLRMGLTARLSRKLFVQPSVSYRLNGPGNSVVFGLNFPYTFGL